MPIFFCESFVSSSFRVTYVFLFLVSFAEVFVFGRGKDFRF